MCNCTCECMNVQTVMHTCVCHCAVMTWIHVCARLCAESLKHLDPCLAKSWIKDRPSGLVYNFVNNHLKISSNWENVVAFVIRNYGISPWVESISDGESCGIFAMKYWCEVMASFCRSAMEFNCHGGAILNGHYKMYITSSQRLLFILLMLSLRFRFTNLWLHDHHCHSRKDVWQNSYSKF